METVAHSAVKTILSKVVRNDAPHNSRYPDDKVRLIGEQIDHEQQVIRDALKSNAVYMKVELEPLYLGFFCNYGSIQELRRENSYSRKIL